MIVSSQCRVTRLSGALTALTIVIIDSVVSLSSFCRFFLTRLKGIVERSIIFAEEINVSFKILPFLGAKSFLDATSTLHPTASCKCLVLMTSYPLSKLCVTCSLLG